MSLSLVLAMLLAMAPAAAQAPAIKWPPQLGWRATIAVPPGIQRKLILTATKNKEVFDKAYSCIEEYK